MGLHDIWPITSGDFRFFATLVRLHGLRVLRG